jgi:CotH kinase protein/Lamin Tail Domain/Secretion system C-terminal sorting domain
MNSKKILLFFAFLLSSFIGKTQNLPREFYFSGDGKMLQSGGKPATGVYDESKITVINITFTQPDFIAQMKSNYASKKEILANMTINGVKYDSIGVRFKGQTSYQKVANTTSEKFSFNISLDFVRPKQNINGYQTFNLNNSFEDPSFLREVFYYHNIRRHMLAAKASFVHLYINGKNWGTYQNIQQQNGDFLSEWFPNKDGSNWRCEAPSGSVTPPGGGGGGGGFGAGTSSLNYIDDDTTTYKKYYTLHSSGQKEPWKDFPQMTKALNKTEIAKLEEEAGKFLDIDRETWHLASENLFSDDDSYINKGGMDYYLTHETTTGRFISYDYDGNTVMAANAATWSPFYNQEKTTHPLLNKLLQAPTIRQRYLAHLRTLISEYFDEKSSSTLLDKYAAQIDSVVKADPKKPTTYAQFQSEIQKIKTFIATRKNSLLANIEVKEIAPTIQSVNIYSNGVAWQKPTDNEGVTVRAGVSTSTAVAQVFLYYGTEIYGRFTKIEMFDDGKNDDGIAKDGVFGIKIPKQKASAYVRFYVEAVGNNTSKSVSYAPVGAEHDVFIYQVQSGTNSVASSVIINEIMASNKTGTKDENGQFEDWIELYNKSDNIVDVSGYFLTDDIVKPKKWAIPIGTKIAGKGFLTLWADEDEKQGALHTNFKLSSGGEFVYLYTPLEQLADSVTFGIQQNDVAFARNPNGTGKFKAQSPTFGTDNEKAAISTGGTGTGGTTTTVLSNEEVLPLYAIKIMPNPASQEIKIRLEGVNKPTKIQIINTFGIEVYQSDYQEDMIVSLANFQSGIYFVRCENIIQKLVVK